MKLSLNDQTFDFSRPYIMGILNVTPDSFSDGGLFIKKDSAIKHVKQMIKEGADIIDVGGESTRPGAQRISLDEELQRVIPVIKTIREFSDIPISIDTKNARVMSEAVHAGASMINDVNALRGEGALAMAVELAVPVCLMHMQGQPDTMQKAPQYEDVVKEVKTYLQERINVCVKAGIKTSNLIIDPGIGFGKSVQHNLCLLKHLAEFNELGKPLLLGVSRKSMIGALLNNAPADERLYASVALATLAAWMDTGILRVHDVKATNDALTLCQAVKEAK